MALHALKSKYMLREYRIEKLLGEGGFGLTYLAFDTNLEKQVAIKEYMPSEHAIRKDDSQIVAKSSQSETVYNWGLNAFLNEAKTLAKFEDSNIVRIYRFFKANGTAYIVMEYCEGGCLIDRVSKDIHMQEDQLIKIISAIAHGLQMVHDDGILHRDIKPDNIMFRQNGTPVLIDFGAARQAIGDKSRKVTTIITPGYAPLEQYSTSGSIGPWSDIYSLSAVAYLCLTGNRPPDIMNRLHEDTIKKLSHVNSSAFLKSIDKGLQLQVDDRPKSLSDWSSSWTSRHHTEIKSKQFIPRVEPIYAQKRGDNTPTVGRPISARTSIEPYEQTIVNSNSLELDRIEKKGKNRYLFIILLLILTPLGGYYGYNFYLDHQAQKLEIEKENEQKKLVELNQNKQQRALVLQVQQILNQLDYIVPEDGYVETRTTESIKLFEKKNQMIVTGKIDAPLLKELLKQLNSGENTAWQQAEKLSTIDAYQNYLHQYPDGIYSSHASNNIESINRQIKTERDAEILKQKLADEKAQELIKQQELQDLQAQQQEQKEQQQRLKQIAIQKAQLIKDIQLVFKRLKFKNINTDGKLDRATKNNIIAYQKIKKIEKNGLPTKTLLFLLNAEEKWPGRLNGETFSDCEDCPIMVVIPAGNYMMGSNTGKSSERPPHNVTLKEFSLSTTEITFKHWNACVTAESCTQRPIKFVQDNQAAMLINWHDAQEYVNWLKKITGKNYRLPSEAEWEYAARAGSTTAYSWGDEIGTNNVTCNGCNKGEEVSIINKVKTYPSNAYGLYDMHGNVWEWTADCWHPTYSGAPSDNLAWEPNGCRNFVVRGGSGGNIPEDLRSSNRAVMESNQRINSLGFRIAVD